MSLQNLKAELVKNKITQAAVADYLDMSLGNFNLKIREKIPMTISEAKAIRDHFFPLATLDYLCESDSDEPGEREASDER